MFKIGDYVSFVHHVHGTVFGTITQTDTETEGYYDDDDEYVEEDSWLTFYIEYAEPISNQWGEEMCWWCNEEDITPVKKERVPSGFAMFVKKVEDKGA